MKCMYIASFPGHSQFYLAAVYEIKLNKVNICNVCMHVCMYVCMHAGTYGISCDIYTKSIHKSRNYWLGAASST